MERRRGMILTIYVLHIISPFSVDVWSNSVQKFPLNYIHSGGSPSRWHDRSTMKYFVPVVSPFVKSLGSDGSLMAEKSRMWNHLPWIHRIFHRETNFVIGFLPFSPLFLAEWLFARNSNSYQEIRGDIILTNYI